MKYLVSVLLLLTLNASAGAQELLRVGSWNTANKPNDNEDNDAFSVAIAEMGIPDVFAIQETDTGSSVTLLDLFNQQVPGNPFSIFVTDRDGGNDRTGLIYNTDRVQLLDSADLSNGLTHNTARASFLPLFLAHAEPLTIYSVHLKSGPSSDDVRGIEAAILANDAAQLGDDNILFAGDFNLLSSDEPAWANIGGNDLANAPGDWRDNFFFRFLHTQNPSISVDDRFDIMFDGGGLTDNQGLDYLPDTYRVLGNNGTHDLNGSIDTGTGASPDVLQSLITASDHLPIYADFVVVSIPGAVLLGDVNLDGVVDFADIPPFIALLSTEGFQAEADIDLDGSITFMDIPPFIDILITNNQSGP